MKLSILLFVILLVSTSIAFPDAGPEELSYEDSTQVSYKYTKDEETETFKNVSPWTDGTYEIGVCDTKQWHQQSPINIVDHELEGWQQGSNHYADDFGGFYTNGELASDGGVMVAYFNNTISLGMVFQEKAISAIFQNSEGIAQTYEVSRVIFHAPAEHTFDGKQADIEMQIVMYDQSKAAGFYDEDDDKLDGYSAFLHCMGDANSNEDATEDEVDEAEHACSNMDYRGIAMVSFFFDDDKNMITDLTDEQQNDQETSKTEQTGFLDEFVISFQRLMLPKSEEFVQIFGFGEDTETSVDNTSSEDVTQSEEEEETQSEKVFVVDEEEVVEEVVDTTSGDSTESAKRLKKVFGPNTHKTKGSVLNKAMDDEEARNLCGDDEPDFECGKLDFSEFFESLDYHNDIIFYQGSNTIPNCIQNVNWYLFTEVHPASQQTVDFLLDEWKSPEFNDNYDQFEEFKRTGNNRPIQETNNRKVWSGSASYWTDLVVPFNNDGTINWKQSSDNLKAKTGYGEDGLYNIQ